MINKNDRAVSFGDADFGKLGRTGDHDEPMLMELSQTVIQVIAGQQFTLLLTSEGDVYACGSGAEGGTGLGIMASQRRPTKVRTT